MNRATRMKLERLEDAKRAREAEARTRQENQQKHSCFWRPNYTPQQHAVADQFEAWFAAEFPPIDESRLGLRVPGRFEGLSGLYGLPYFHQTGMYLVARKAFVEWWANHYPGTPLEDVHPYDLMVHDIRYRIYLEIYCDALPIEQQRYFFHPSSLNIWKSNLDKDGREMVSGGPIFTLRVIASPTGELLERARKFAQAWPHHNPARRLAGLLTLEEVARGDGPYFAPVMHQVPADWIPPGCR